MLYKICFYVPTSHVESVKEKMFESGAGKIGQYSCCAWQSLGEGQFMPLSGSHAYLGEINQIEKVAEYKVEMVCDETHLRDAINALKTSHPYEEPAYHVMRIESI